MIQNIEKISRITMKPKAHCLCAIGQDWYTLNLQITLEPDEYYPDYMSVVKWIADEIDGKELNIEQAIQQIWGYITNTYFPKSCTVTAEVNDATTHFPVIVTKEK